MAKKILVVEDEILLLEMMKDRLKFKGYEVLIADNGKDGAFKAISEGPDLIIADLLMPEIDGMQMIKIIRSDSNLKKVPIIVISALGRDEDVEKAIAAGANDYIVKPYSVDDLMKKIEGFLK
ncbi:MAG: response regulator transcription factor [Pseudomonadota bacterium]